MTLEATQVEKAVRAGDESRVRELLRDATEAERRVCASELKAFLDEPDQPGVEYEHRLARTAAFGVAAVGLARGAVPAYRAWQWVQLGAATGWTPPETVREAIVGVLADRNPRWLASFADRMLREQWTALRQTHWQIVRDLVRLGLIEKPDRPEYTTAMVAGIYAWEWRFDLPLTTPLHADPGLLDDEVWRLFSVPEAGAALSYSAWGEVLATLAAESAIPRGRLLDACLGAFVRDFPPNHVGWYLELHDRLAPSPGEKTARTGQYLALLSASSKTGVTLGQRECGALLDAGVLDPREFLAASPAALLFPQKSAATAQLKLIGALIKARPDVRDDALAMAATAFGHEREDVQAAALKLIKKHGVPADDVARAAVESWAAALSPVLGPEAAALGLVPALSPVPPAGDDVGQSVPSVAASRVDCVEDPDELVQLLARLIEDASDMPAVERAVAGAVRLASLPLAERSLRAGPVLKRAREQSWGPEMVWLNSSTEGQLGFLTIAWATGELKVRTYPAWMDEEEPNVWPPPVTKPDPAHWDPADPVHGVLSARLWEACHLVISGPGGPLLAEPEFADGTISQAAFLGRLAQWRPGSGGPPSNDFESALFRLAPDADDEFWRSWDAAPAVAAGKAPSAEAAQAMYQQAHVVCEFEPLFVPRGEIAPRELLLQPSGAPGMLGAVQKFRGVPGPDPGSRCWRVLTFNFAGPEPGALGGYIAGFSSERELPLLLPYQPELVAAHLLRPLSDGLAPGSHPAAREAAASLAAVGVATGSAGGTGRVFGPICHLALVTGMSSASADTRIAAASAWARVAPDGRLDPGLAAEAITGGVCANLFKLNRIAESLGQAALDPTAAASIGAVCLAASASLLSSGRPGLHLLLELAARCLTATAGSALPGVPGLPVAIADLAGSRDRTKLAEAARRLARLADPARVSSSADGS